MSSDNMVTFEKFLGSGMKQETSDHDSPKIGNAYERSSTAALNNLCKPLPVFCVDNNAPLHSARICLK